jgi:hypothetical protein
MKPTRLPIIRPAFLHALTAAAISLPLAAQTLHWNEAPSGGLRDGTWDEATTTNWNSSPAGPPPADQAWPAPPVAAFTTAAFQKTEGGTVTVFGSVSAAGIRAGEGGAYTITGGTIARPGNILVVNVGTLGSGTLAIGSTIDAADLIKNGGGTLELTGTATGNLRAQGGLVTLSGNNLPDTAIADVLPGGELRLLGDETIGDLLIDGTLSGPGTLTASTYSLLDGAVIDGHLGEGTLFKSDPGIVTVNGTLGSNIVSVPGGTLVLSGNNLDDLAQTSTSGGATLQVDGADTVGSYLQTSNGSLTGSGILNAAFGATLNSGEVAGNLAGDTVSTGDVLVSGSTGGGSLDVTGGTLTLAGSSTNDTVNIGPGTTLLDQGDLGDTAEITNNNILTVDSIDTVGRYTQNAGAILNGSGSLTSASMAYINGGEIAGTLLGSAASSGTVLISGRTGGGTLGVRGGVLTLTGEAASPDIVVDQGATFVDQGDIGDTSMISNKGTLSVQVNDTVKGYTQLVDGLLEGPGTLTATGGSTVKGGEIAGTLLGDLNTQSIALISGTVGGGHWTLDNGQATLTGTSTHETIWIEGAARLYKQGDLSDTTALTNHGRLYMETDDTIGSYVQDQAGELHGPATLTVKNGATLNGGDIRGTLMGDVATTNASEISGTIGGGSLTVMGGLVGVSGTILSPEIFVRDGALWLGGDNVADTSTIDVFPRGAVHLAGDDTVGPVTIAGRIDGPGTLTAPVYTLLDGAVINGRLGEGVFDKQGAGIVEFSRSGTLGSDVVHVPAGTLLLSGTNLEATAILSNAPGSTIQLDGDQTVNTFTSSGILSGSGHLAATNGATLNDGEISGNLLADITSTGHVLVSGTIGGGFLDVTAGTLTITGTSTSDPVSIQPGATLVDMSPNALGDTADITNGGLLVLNGSETVGSYHNRTGASLQLDVTSPAILDRLVATTVTLDAASTLVLETTDLALGQMADIIDGAITGTFADINPQAGAGAALRYSFNPDDGTIQAIPAAPVAPKGSPTLFNLTENQTSAIGTAFEDTHIDPPGGGGNFRRVFYREIDPGNPDPALRWMEIPAAAATLGDTFALDLDPGLGRVPTAPGTQARLLSEAISAFQASYRPGPGPAGDPIVAAGPAGLAVANMLSPEVHQGMADHTELAMRAHLRAARNAASAGPIGDNGQIFATAHSSSAGATSAVNNASYDIQLHGLVAGLRYQVAPRIKVGALLGVDDASIEGALVDTDGCGITLGAFAEVEVDAASQTNLFGGLSIGRYDYDATRQSFGGPVFANGIGADAIELAIGIETVAYEQENLRVVPARRAALPRRIGRRLHRSRARRANVGRRLRHRFVPARNRRRRPARGPRVGNPNRPPRLRHRLQGLRQPHHRRLHRRRHPDERLRPGHRRRSSRPRPRRLVRRHRPTPPRPQLAHRVPQFVHHPQLDRTRRHHGVLSSRERQPPSLAPRRSRIRWNSGSAVAGFGRIRAQT